MPSSFHNCMRVGGGAVTSVTIFYSLQPYDDNTPTGNAKTQILIVGLGQRILPVSSIDSSFPFVYLCRQPAPRKRGMSVTSLSLSLPSHCAHHRAASLSAGCFQHIAGLPSAGSMHGRPLSLRTDTEPQHWRYGALKPPQRNTKPPESRLREWARVRPNGVTNHNHARVVRSV